MKLWKKISIVAASLLVVIVLYMGFILFTTPLMSVEYRELQRQPSPDGRVEAVYITSNGGATDTMHYWVYVVPEGLKTKKIVKSKYHTPVFHAEYLHDMNLTWEGPGSLHIEYGSADVTIFQDHVYPFKGDDTYKVNAKENSI